MVVNVEGEVINAGKTKNGTVVLTILVKRPDGMRDALTVFVNSGKEYKPGQVFKGAISVYTQTASEV